jgi:glycosyltransferase involved in cell wall biosynthesis
MRALVLAAEAPVPARSGATIRIVALARSLARDADVHIAAIAGGEPPQVDEPFTLSHHPGDWSHRRSIIRALREPWPVAQIRSASLQRRVRQGDWDVVQAHTLPTARFIAAERPSVFAANDVMAGVTKSLAAVDSRRTMRSLWRYETLKNLRLERIVVRRASAVTVPTDADAERFAQLGARRVVVVPNGVDLERAEHALPGSGAQVAYVGYFAWRPNVEAAIELCDEILPRIRARVASASLTLVGASAPPELSARSGDAITLTGQVEDVIPPLRQARVAVMPLRSGGGSSHKVLETLALGVPLVATPFAVRGFDVRHGREALIGSTSAELAELAVKAIEDDELAASLSRAGRRLVEQRYSWQAAARPMIELHHELAERHRYAGSARV